jgi:hypothetical protein
MPGRFKPNVQCQHSRWISRRGCERGGPRIFLAALQLVLRHGGTGADRGHCAAKPTCWLSRRVETELAADHRSSRWPGSADSLTPRHNAVGPPNNPRVEEHVEDADGQPNGP